MIINGIDLAGLAAHAPEKFAYPKATPGRVVHIDADFLAYQCSYERPDEPKSLDEMYHNVREITEVLKGMSGATKAVLHLTPKESTKGGRHEIAMLKEYQGNRVDKVKPRYLHVVREHMHKEMGAVMHMTCEADDGMSMAQYAKVRDGMTDQSVIATKDKDLSMVPGWHLDWDTGELTKEEGRWGYIHLVQAGKVKKLRGRGWKFFWAQLLMGDSADNISGVPFIAGRVLAAKYPGSKGIKKCGAVTTYELLEHIPSSEQAFILAKALYEDCHAVQPFVNYRDQSPITWGDALVSEMKLLWMRRYDDENDVIHWLKELKEP